MRNLTHVMAVAGVAAISLGACSSTKEQQAQAEQQARAEQQRAQAEQRAQAQQQVQRAQSHVQAQDAQIQQQAQQLQALQAQQSQQAQQIQALQAQQARAQQAVQTAVLSGNPETLKQAQSKLSTAGYSPGPVDGKMGPKTQAALKNFQQSQGLQASGWLDPKTAAALGMGAGSADSGATSGSSSGGKAVK